MISGEVESITKKKVKAGPPLIEFLVIFDFFALFIWYLKT